MSRVTFLIGIDSYIIRKGIVSILKNISGAGVVFDTEHYDVIKNQLKEHDPDFLVLSPSLLEKCSHLFTDNITLSEKTILLAQKGEMYKEQNTRTIIQLGDSKQDIILQFEALIHPFSNRKKAGYSSILSEREITILKHISEGNTNKQIAEKLFLSLHTVTTHRKNIGNKLGIKSVSGLTVYAIVNNIISIEDIANTTR